MSWEKLTGRERQTAILLLKGYKNKSAAQVLMVSPRTIETYRSQVFSKFGVTNAKQLRETIALPAEADKEFEEMNQKLADVTAFIEEQIRRRALGKATQAALVEQPKHHSRSDVQNVQFLASKVLPPLVGATIHSIAYITDVSGPFDTASIGLVVNLVSGERKIAWIDMDPEGNGPGWVKVEDAVRKGDLRN